MTKFICAVASIVLVTGFTACKSLNKTQAETGKNNAGLKTILADFRTNNTMAGALMDGLLTGEAGIYISKRMDNEAEQIEKMIPGAEVKRIGQGINITFESGFLFDKASADIGSSARENLEKLAAFFNSNPDTKILIEGHASRDTTLAIAEKAYMQLSKERALAVSNYLKAKGVAANRITEKWYGDTQPKYANDTEANREKNRRVEIGLVADEAFRKMAMEGKNK